MEILQRNSLIPDVMRHDMMPHALRLVTIWKWDTHDVGSLFGKTVIGTVTRSLSMEGLGCA
jgi:hypothetical protein